MYKAPSTIVIIMTTLADTDSVIANANVSGHVLAIFEMLYIVVMNVLAVDYFFQFDKVFKILVYFVCNLEHI